MLVTPTSPPRVLGAGEAVLQQPAGVAGADGRVWSAAVPAVRRHQHCHVSERGGRDQRAVGTEEVHVHVHAVFMSCE